MFNGQGTKAQRDQGVKVLRDLKLESLPIIPPRNALAIAAGDPTHQPIQTHSNAGKIVVKKLNKINITYIINRYSLISTYSS